MTEPVDELPVAELGVALDVAHEQRRRIANAKEFSGRTHADLDGYADGDLAESPTAHLRDAQAHLRAASDLLDSEEAVVASRIEAIEKRIESEVSDE